MTTDPLTAVLERLPDHKRAGDGWTARCPAHDDHDPSLSIARGDGGRVLLRCHANCSTAAVVHALGLRMADLMPPDGPGRRVPASNGRKPQPTGPRFRTAEAAIAALEREHGRRAAQWTYRDAQGEPVGVVVRWDLAGGGKDIRPVSRTAGGWTVGGMPEPRPLYNLPELLARLGERVYVCEGEKAADAAASVGLLATTSPHGAKSAAKADWRPLAGRDVVVLPDADDAGRQYASAVAGILAGLNPPAIVRICELPGLPAGGDFMEYLEARDSFESEAIAEQVHALADACPPVGQANAAGPVLTCMADVEPREVQWLWPGRVPLGRITLLVGRPGEGKSFLTTDMAARVTTGTCWPDGSPCPSGSVLMVSAEDDPADTIRPRLDAASADVARVHLLSAVRRLDDNGEPREVMFTLADVAALEAALRAHSECKLIVVDPIGSFLGGGTDSFRDNEVRGVLAPIAKLAERHGPAVLVVAHRRKSSAANADDLALGSVGFVGIARSVLHLSRDQADSGRRLLLPGKNNLAAESFGLAFRIMGEPPSLAWEPDPVLMRADDALVAEKGTGDRERPGPEPEARDAAAEWLREVLKDGPQPAADIKAEAAAAELAWRTVHRAADRIGVRRIKAGFGVGWKWELPAEDATRRCHPPQDGNNLASWHLRENIGENADSELGTFEDAKLKDLGTFGL